MDCTLFADISGLTRGPADPINEQTPLIVAIHGGTYTSGYFDVPGYSLLERAAINGLKAIAIDRPSYGTTPSLDPGDMAIDGQARYLARALDEAWRVYGESTRGIVLIGHSIGAAIAATIASEPSGLPVLGLAISGVGLRTPGTHGPLWQSLPDTPTVEMPAHIKDQLMFGPAGSFDPAMPSASYGAYTHAPKPELVDITGAWSARVRDVLGKIAVPVHYRQGEFDNLWIVDQGEIDGFSGALTASPRVDAAMMRGTGHCIDFHHAGAALQLQQIGFALECALAS